MDRVLIAAWALGITVAICGWVAVFAMMIARHDGTAPACTAANLYDPVAKTTLTVTFCEWPKKEEK